MIPREMLAARAARTAPIRGIPGRAEPWPPGAPDVRGFERAADSGRDPGVGSGAGGVPPYGFRMRLRPAAMTALALAASVLALAGCSSSATAPDSATASAAPSATTASAAASAGPSGAVPRPAHVVVVIEENKAYGQVAGEP